MSQERYSRKVSFGQIRNDVNSNGLYYPRSRESSVADYQTSLPIPPNQMNRGNANQYRLPNDDGVFSFTEQNIVRSDRTFSGNEDRIGDEASERRRGSRSAERFITENNQRESLDGGWSYFDESSNQHLDSSRRLFSGNRSYNREALNDSRNGYEMKTKRVSTTRITETFDNDSFV